MCESRSCEPVLTRADRDRMLSVGCTSVVAARGMGAGHQQGCVGHLLGLEEGYELPGDKGKDPIYFRTRFGISLPSISCQHSHMPGHRPIKCCFFGICTHTSKRKQSCLS